jgi:hypothetical protein
VIKPSAGILGAAHRAQAQLPKNFAFMYCHARSLLRARTIGGCANDYARCVPTGDIARLAHVGDECDLAEIQRYGVDLDEGLRGRRRWGWHLRKENVSGVAEVVDESLHGLFHFALFPILDLSFESLAQADAWCYAREICRA